MSHLEDSENNMKPIMWVGILLVILVGLGLVY
jgi:hypothetical protein